MKTLIKSETDLIDYGRKLAQCLQAKQFPVVIELIGDVGVGKTTLTRGLAEGLGVAEPVTSPSFTIAKRYHFPVSNENTSGVLVHYDFYRLPDPGIMYEELAETLESKNTIVVIEWGESVREILPETHIVVRLTINNDGTRTVVESK